MIKSSGREIIESFNLTKVGNSGVKSNRTFVSFNSEKLKKNY